MSLFPNLSREQLEQRLAEANRREKYLEDEVKALSSRCFKRFNEEECWIYTPDENNHLDSLVCPVVISAELARTFEKAAAMSYVYMNRGRCESTIEAAKSIFNQFPNAKELAEFYFPHKTLGKFL